MLRDSGKSMKRFFQLLLVTGEDAGSFLQGQLTQDVDRLPAAVSLPTAWCNPRGRVLCVARLLEIDGGIGLVIPGELLDPVVKGLSIYRLRAKVTFGIPETDWRCLAVAAEDDLAALEALDLLPDRRRNATRRAGGVVAVDTGAARRCIEVYGTATAIEHLGLCIVHPLPDIEWQKALIDAGIPTLVTATSEQYTPHMLNLDRLGAVSFSKGCYTGQEIVARTEHLGSSKRRLMHYRLDAGSAEIGDKLTFDEHEVGDIINIVDHDLLAVVPLNLHDQTLTINGRPAHPVGLPYPLPPGKGDA